MDIDGRLRQAVQSYWDARSQNKAKQVAGGKIGAGTRGGVTGGTQMGAIEVLVSDILCDAGLNRIDIRTRTALELPGSIRLLTAKGINCSAAAWCASGSTTLPVS
jgi:hypothetical protein